MEDHFHATNHLEFLTNQALQTLQDPYYNPESANYKNLAALLRNTDFFKRNLTSSSNLEDFIELAKWHLNYEVHPYGTILTKEQDCADRLCIILRGSVQKLQQRPFSEVEQEAKETERRDSFLSIAEALNVPVERKNKRRATMMPQTSQFTINIHTDNTNIKNDPKAQQTPDEHPASHSKRSSMILKANPSLNELDMDLPKPQFSTSFLCVKQTHVTSIGSLSSFAKEHKEQKEQIKQRHSIYLNQSMLSHQLNESAYPSFMEYNEDKESNEKESESGCGENHKENLGFIKLIASKSPEMNQRCFMKNVTRVRVNKIYKTGDCFGENFCRHHQTKENAIIAVSSEEVHLLSITRENYKTIISQMCTQVNLKAQFFKKLFSSVEEKTAIKFSKYFNERTLQKGEIFFIENEALGPLYFVQAGEVKLTKEKEVSSPVSPNPYMSILKQQKKKLPIAIMKENQFFGEEFLLEESSRNFTATANISNTEVYYLELKVYKKIKDKFDEIFEILREQAKERSDWRNGRALDLIAHQKLNNNSPISNRSFYNEKSSNAKTPYIPSQFTFKGPEILSLQRVDSNNNNNNNSTARTQSIQNIPIRRSSFISGNNSPEQEQTPQAIPQNSEVYKQLYGRTFKFPAYLENEENSNSPTKTGKYTKRISIDNFSQKNILEFNVRKELEISSPKKYNLPKITSILSPTNSSQNTSCTSPKLKKKLEIIGSNGKTKAKSMKLKISPLVMTHSLTPVSAGILSPSQKLSKFSYLQTSQLNGSPRETNKSIFDVKSSLLSMGDVEDSPDCVITDHKKIGKLLQTVKYRPNKNKLSKIIMKGISARSSTSVNALSIQGLQGKH